MRLVTTCPSCSASFYVSPEQLSAHRGDVRCGKCSTVFNALDALNQLDQQNNAKSTDRAPTPAPANPTVKSPVSAETTKSNQTESPVQTTDNKNIDTFKATDFPPLEDVPEENTDVFPPVMPEKPAQETVTAAEEPKQPIAEPEPVPQQTEAPAVAEELSENENKESLDEEEQRTLAQLKESINPNTSYSFEDEKNRGKNTKSKLPRWALVVMSITLFITAAVQASYQFRTEIAAQWPQTKPYLVKACQQLRCTVPLPQYSDLIIIDDSNLQEDPEHEGVIELSTTFINNAAFIQAYPLLQITLTDNYEQPKLRRILKPQQYLSTTADIKNGMAPGAEVNVNLALTTSDEPVSGYRVSVYY